MERNHLYYSTILGLVLLLIASCGNRNDKSSVLRVERSPEWGVEKTEDNVAASDDMDDAFATIPDIPYEPKVIFTGRESMEVMCELAPGENALGKVNTKYLDGCYYTGDTSTRSLLPSLNGVYKLERAVHRFLEYGKRSISPDRITIQ